MKSVWLITGSQDLYGPEVLATVGQNAAKMVRALNQSPLPLCVVGAGVMRTAAEVTDCIKRANADDDCLGIVTWMHTFSPSKMWVSGLALLQKPYCHLHTQFHRNLPHETLDMDYMNTHQSAHGDREHGHIAARLGLPRAIIAGYWQDARVRDELVDFMRAAMGCAASRAAVVMRFGDNMRQVAVTEGDKVSAQLKLGWQVNTWPVYELMKRAEQVPETRLREMFGELSQRYDVQASFEQVAPQLAVQTAMREMMDEQGACALTTTFEDLGDLPQLPGLAIQELTRQGYGFGAEGDWKTAALLAVCKAMSTDLPGANAFMEDYTYDLTEGQELCMGAHMLEVCPTLAADRPRVVAKPLGIGGKEAPARLIFAAEPGAGVLVSLVDLGHRFRMVIQEIDIIDQPWPTPALPVAPVIWRTRADFATASTCWLLAGGAHHAVLSTALNATQVALWAGMMGVECLTIGATTRVDDFKLRLGMGELMHR